MIDPDNSRYTDEDARAKELAFRYGCEFADLHNFTLNHEPFKRVPAEVMFRFNFLPLEEMPDGRLAITIADPSQLLLLDEISLLLGRPLIVRVAALSRINEILRGIDPRQQEMTSQP
jgi:type IV pilus assembly protein PilB